jgi:DNA-cytosine methyltransferase
MKYGSVCSGIEAASVAWHDLGWEPQWFSEIEQFPSEVLKHRFPTVPNLGDMTTINQNPIADERPIDLLVGGTPCQSFSVAGLRKGLADPRGNLMLTFLSIADKFRPKWVVWENVPGVLSSNGGRDFGTFLGALGELGYGFAYRVLDAQHFGVAQRRRRVFVVGYLGDWRVAAAVLFERESLQGNTKPSRKKREEVTSDVEGSVGEAGDSQPIAFKVRGGCEGGGKGYLGQEEQAFTISTMQDQQIAQPIGINGNIAGTIDANYFKGCGSANFGERDVVAQPIAVDTYNQTISEHTSQTIGSSASDVNHYGAVLHSMAIRRLTPK